MSDKSTETAVEKQPDKKATWLKNKVHTITLPSGTQIDIKIPNLALLAKAGELPNDLLKLAVPEIAGNEPEPTNEDEAKKAFERLAAYQAWLVHVTVVDPAVEVEEVVDLPTEDVETIVAFATRQRDTDITGHQLGGLETQAAFREARGLAPLE